MAKKVDITQLIDEGKISALTYTVLVLGFLVTVTEGFDITAAAYTMPGILQEWGISRKVGAAIISITPMGMLLGSTVIGYLGDRFGRKPAILAALAWFGLMSVACAFASSIQVLIALRFLMGIGAGGLMTNNLSLISEYAPMRRRPGFVMMVAMGMTFGGITVALTSAMIPAEAWRLIFIIGGAASLLTWPFVLFLMPESIKFLLRDPKRLPEARALAKRVAKDTDIPEDAELVVAERAVDAKDKTSFLSLFAGKLLYITPFIWVTLIAVQAANVGVSNWLPTLLQDSALSHRDSALTASAYYAGGIVGILTIGRLIDRFGFSVLVFTFLLAAPMVFAIAIPHAPPWLQVATVFMTGFTINGTQVGTNTINIIYPSAFRSLGYGTASAVGRIGGVGGPLAFGYLMTLGLPLGVLLLAPIVPLATGAFAALMVARLVSGRFFGGRLREIHPGAAPAPAPAPEIATAPRPVASK